MQTNHYLNQYYEYSETNHVHLFRNLERVVLMRNSDNVCNGKDQAIRCAMGKGEMRQRRERRLGNWTVYIKITTLYTHSLLIHEEHTMVVSTS